jgi:uncharacterized membrane protein (UPF0127 family)
MVAVLRFCTLLLAACAAIPACAGDDASRPAPTSTAAVTATPAATSAPTASAETVTVTFPGGELDVELADTPDERALGLGGRDALAVDAGMLFDLGSTRVPSFSMRGMRFPLDMIWIAEDGEIVAVTADVPHEPGAPDSELRRYSPPEAVRYVLEVNAGTAARLGLAPGVTLAFDIPTSGAHVDPEEGQRIARIQPAT